MTNHTKDDFLKLAEDMERHWVKGEDLGSFATLEDLHRRAIDALRLAAQAGECKRGIGRYPAIWVRQESRNSMLYAVVLIEIDGKWVELIRELEGTPYSHIIEPRGIDAALAAEGKGL
mgnify:CR=1 FL=1